MATHWAEAMAVSRNCLCRGAASDFRNSVWQNWISDIEEVDKMILASEWASLAKDLQKAQGTYDARSIHGESEGVVLNQV